MPVTVLTGPKGADIWEEREGGIQKVNSLYMARGALCTGLELQVLRVSDHHDFYRECRWNGRMRAHMLWWASHPVMILKEYL